MEKKNLSKSILQMKFMKKSKEKVEKENDDEEGRTIYASEITSKMKFVKSNYILEGSYVPCEDLLDGRVSFRGINPEIERLLEEERNVKMAKKVVENFEKEKHMQTDVSDLDMLNAYNANNSLVKNISKKFQNKRQYNNQHSKRNFQPGPNNKKARFMKPNDD